LYLFAICTPCLPGRRVRDRRNTGEIVLLSEKVLFIVAGLLAVVLAIAALVMWAF
jgi:cytochrome b subunit of formate dehydrogenase